MSIKRVKQFKNILGIKTEIIGIRFFQKPPLFNYKHHRDTFCTALARAILKKRTTIFNTERFSQLCEGGNYFLRFSATRDSEACAVYVRDEHVFANKAICSLFLQGLPKFPDKLRDRFVVIQPFNGRDKADLVILLVSPAQAGRILGVLNYKQYEPIEFYPNQPTCLSLFAPLATKKPHCNFIDYYDRYYQGIVRGKKIWPEGKMLISLRLRDFIKILNNLKKSPQGCFHPKIKPQRVDVIK